MYYLCSMYNLADSGGGNDENKQPDEDFSDIAAYHVLSMTSVGIHISVLAMYGCFEQSHFWW